MTLETILSSLPDYAKDLKLNLKNVLSERGAPGLTPTQIFGTALASAVTTGQQDLIRAIDEAAGDTLSDADRRGARAAAAIMGMTNVYYRSVHLIDNEDYGNLPAQLRMTILGNPGIEKVDFELYSMAVSAINGCGMCLNGHEAGLRKLGVETVAIQTSLRIGAVVSAVAAVLNDPSVSLEQREAA
jgi:alkyl hydroperoxide reductase subunit D